MTYEYSRRENTSPLAYWFSLDKVTKWNTTVLPPLIMILTLKVFPLLHEGGVLSPEMFGPQWTESNAFPLPIQLQPSRLYDVKLILDVTQKGPETWFRTPQRFQRCSKSYCWIKTAYGNGPWSISQSFQADFTRTCWSPLIKRKEQNTPIKEEEERFFLAKSFFCKSRTGSLNLHSGSSAFAQFKWETNRERDKQYEQPLWLHKRATYQAPSNMLRCTPWMLAQLKQDMNEGQ